MENITKLNHFPQETSFLTKAEMGWWEWDLTKLELADAENLEWLFPIRNNILKAIHPDDQTAFNNLLKGETESEIHFRVVMPEGGWRWLATRCKVVRGSGGEPKKALGWCWELDKVKQTQTNIQEEKDLLAAILDTAGALVVVLDRSGRIVKFNRACVTTTGYPAVRLQGELFWQIFLSSEDIEQWRFDVWETGQTIPFSCELEFPTQQETDCITRYGTRRRIAWTNTVLRDGQGRLKYVIATGIDITHRVEAEAAKNQMIVSLQKSQQRFRATFEQAAVGIAHCTLDGRFLRINQRFCDILGYSSTEIQQLSFQEITAPEDLAIQIKPIDRLNKHHTSTYSIEKRFLKKDGTKVWVNKTVSLVTETIEDQTTQYLIVVIEDISSRKNAEIELAKAKNGLKGCVRERTKKLWKVIQQLRQEIASREQVEKALRTSEAQTRSLASLLAEAQKVAHVGCWEFDVKTEQLTWSDEFYQILGIQPGSVTPSFAEYWQRVHSEDIKLTKKAVKQVLQEGIPYEFHQRIIRPSGEIRHLAGKGQTIRSQQGKVLKLFGTILDITEHKLVEENLRKSEKLIREKALQLEEALQVLKQTQGQLIQTEKMISLGQLVAGVAHEINNPVNFIYGNISYANEYIRDLQSLVRLYQTYYPEPAPAVQTYMETVDFDFLMEDLPKLFASIQVGAERIREIVRSLRNFSRLDEAEMKKVNIHEGIESTLLILQHRLKEKGNHRGIEVMKNFGNVPEVECYPAQLNQVFMNLFSNAIDAVETQTNVRRITIYTELVIDGLQEVNGRKNLGFHGYNSPYNSHILIRVQDSGAGIEREFLEKIFDPFFTTKPVGKGTGLGLSISYQIIEKHGGKIKVNSQVGVGTEFQILLPVSQQKANQAVSAA